MKKLLIYVIILTLTLVICLNLFLFYNNSSLSSIVNNSSTSGLPMSSALGKINVPLVTSQQTTTSAVPTVSTVPIVQNNSIAPVPPVSTLPVSNDTVLEAMPSSSVTTIAPKQNTYINPVPGGNSTLDNIPLFDTRNDSITLPTVLPDPITPGSSVGATDFLVQKPLMPNLPAKK